MQESGEKKSCMW